MKEPVSVLGVHIAAKVVWLAGVSPEGDLVSDQTDRLSLAGGGMTEERALAELEESIEGVLERLAPEVVALLEAGTSKRPPPPSTTQRRAWIEGALMIASARRGHLLARVSHAAVKKALGGGPTAPDFRDRVAQHLSKSPPKRWPERAPAYAAGLVALGRAQ